MLLLFILCAFLAYSARFFLQLTIWLLHWNRGSPVWTDQGEYIEKTVWEQVRVCASVRACVRR